MRRFRISPPKLSLGGGVGWALARAFGPPSLVLPSPIGPPEVLIATAHRLDLAARIGGRVPADSLNSELGVERARGLVFAHLQTRATNRLLADCMLTITQVAEERRVPIIWLKHAALWSLGKIRPGERDARDVDVLVEARGAADLQAGLCAEGLTLLGTRAPTYHKPPLRAASGACVEIHVGVWGIRGADASALIASGSVRSAPEAPLVYVPTLELLVAHALVHGLVQHLSSPAGYAPLRVFSDLVDLEAWKLDSREIHHHAAAGLSLDDVRAACALAECLAAGEDATRDFATSSKERALLAHAVNASLRPTYRARLRLLRLRELKEEGGLVQAVARRLGSEVMAGISRLRR